MAFSKWLCTNSTKNMLVKIVHPGGHVELHDRPIMAAEIMHRNPKCIVAHPNVFKQPWAIVAPDTVLCLGQKFYVVPIGTIRKLQRHNSYKNFPLVQTNSPKDEEENETKNLQMSWKKVNSPGKNLSKDRCFLDDNCFMNLIPGSKDRGNYGDDSSEGGSSSSSRFGSSETKGLTSKKRKGFAKGSSKEFATMDHWQPRLESITEEYISN